MKKNIIIKFLKVSLFAVLMIFNAYIVGVQANNRISLSDLLKLNNAQAECIDGYCKNFAADDVTILSYMTWESVGSVTIPVNHYEDIECCVDGTDMDWCDFDMEDSRCEEEVDRNDPC